MATLLKIDESSSDQVGTNDIALPLSGDVRTSLNSFFGNTSWTILQAAKASLLSGLSNTLDLGLTDTAGAALNGLDSGLNDLNGADILLYTDPNNNNLVLGKVGTTVMFALYLDATGSATDAGATGADLWMIEFQPIQHYLNTDPLNAAFNDPNDFVTLTGKLGVTVTNPIHFDLSGAPSGQNLFLMFSDGTPGVDEHGAPDPNEVAIVVTAANALTGGTVNTGQGGGGTTIGNFNQMVDPAEAVLFSFVQGANTNYTVPNLTASEAALEQNIDFANFFESNSASFSVVQLQPTKAATLKIGAFEAHLNPNDLSNPNDDTVWDQSLYLDHQLDNDAVNIDNLTITRSVTSHKVTTVYTVTWDEDVATAVGTKSVGGAAAVAMTSAEITALGLTVTFPGSEVQIKGALAGDNFKYVTDGDHDRVIISNVGNADPNFAAAFDIGGFKIESGGTTTSPLDDIVIYDDGPSMTASSTGAPALTVDESNFAGNDTKAFAGQFTAGYGRDGAAGSSVTYALSTPGGASGLVDTLTGENVVLSRNGTTGNIEGKTATTGLLVFVVSVDGSGNVTLDESRAIVHLANTGADQSKTMTGSNLVVLNATAKDGDNDTASAPLDLTALLNFKDDAPTITGQILGGTVAFAADATGIVSHSLNGSVGADAITNVNNLSAASVKQYTITSFDEPHTVYAHLDGVLSTDGTKVTYYSTDVAANQNATTAVYELALSQSGAGSYTFTVLQPPPLIQNHFTFADLPAGQNLFGIVGQNKANINNNGTPNDTSDDYLPDGGILVFPSDPVLAADGTMTNTSGTVNTSKGGGPVTIGNENQAFDSVGEGAVFMYVDNPNIRGVGTLGLTATSADDADTINFNGMNQATNASVSIVQASGQGTPSKPGPALHVYAWEVSPGNVNTDAEARAVVTNPTAGGTQADIIGIKIHDSTGAVIEYRTVNQSAGGNNTGTLQDSDDLGTAITSADDSSVGIQFVLDNAKAAGTADDIYSAIVSNLQAGYTVEWITSTNHDMAIINNVSGSYDIGGFDITNRANLAAQDFHFSAQITDYDNDLFGGSSTSIANWTVHVNDALF